MAQVTLFLIVKTNIGKAFLKLLKHLFSKINKLHKVFDKKWVSVSYSCRNNMSSIFNRELQSWIGCRQIHKIK